MTLDSALRVLIVEDEIFLAEELGFIIEEAGHDVVGRALDSKAACRMIEKLRPDVVLLDVCLSDGPTGPNVARYAQDLLDHNPAIVFVTGSSYKLPPGVCGAIGVVDKPYTAATIRSVLSYVGRRAAAGLDAGAPPCELRVATAAAIGELTPA